MESVFPQRPSPPADVPSGLSEREAELARWNRPYQFREFPKMLYRGLTTAGGRAEHEQRVVDNEQEEQQALENGWCVNPAEALERETRRQEDLGTAAAERAYADRRLSPAAQAEVAAIDSRTAKHLAEIPEQPRRPRGRGSDAGA